MQEKINKLYCMEKMPFSYFYINTQDGNPGTLNHVATTTTTITYTVR